MSICAYVHSAFICICLLFAYLFLCLCSTDSVSSYTVFVTLFICGSKVAHTLALSISFQQCSLQANPMAVILRYIYVLRAEQRLAVTCVREVVALMEFYTWQPSRLHWYVFKILSRNKTCFCCLLGQISGAVFVYCVPRGAQGIAPEDGDIPKRMYIEEQAHCFS